VFISGAFDSELDLAPPDRPAAGFTAMFASDDLVVATSRLCVIFHPREPQAILVCMQNIHALIRVSQC
jgi:hypothetical protein